MQKSLITDVFTGFHRFSSVFTGFHRFSPVFTGFHLTPTSLGQCDPHPLAHESGRLGRGRRGGGALPRQNHHLSGLVAGELPHVDPCAAPTAGKRRRFFGSVKKGCFDCVFDCWVFFG